MSVFVELLSNPDKINQYNIQMALVHPSDSQLSVVKEHQALFESRESWGFGKLMKTSDLSSRGFIR